MDVQGEAGVACFFHSCLHVCIEDYSSYVFRRWRVLIGKKYVEYLVVIRALDSRREAVGSG